MNMAMRLTVDGLLRALRWRAHSAAEDPAAIRAVAAPDRHAPGARRTKRRPKTSMEEPDGQRRR
jgi:uncharacterized protein (DUF3084 family)